MSIGNCPVAPEVYRRKGYDYKVDIFSVGVVTFILFSPHRRLISSLCGYNPYCGPSGACFRPEGLLLERPYWEHISEPGRRFSILSLVAKDFVRWLLQTDPEKRPSAEECLRHPWITVGILLWCDV